MLLILKFFTSKDTTRETKVKNELLGRKYGCKIPIIEKAWVQGFIFHHSHINMNNEDLIHHI